MNYLPPWMQGLVLEYTSFEERGIFVLACLEEPLLSVQLARLGPMDMEALIRANDVASIDRHFKLTQDIVPFNPQTDCPFVARELLVAGTSGHFDLMEHILKLYFGKMPQAARGTIQKFTSVIYITVAHKISKLSEYPKLAVWLWQRYHLTESDMEKAVSAGGKFHPDVLESFVTAGWRPQRSSMYAHAAYVSGSEHFPKLQSRGVPMDANAIKLMINNGSDNTYEAVKWLLDHKCPVVGADVMLCAHATSHNMGAVSKLIHESGFDCKGACEQIRRMSCGGISSSHRRRKSSYKESRSQRKGSYKGSCGSKW